MPKQPDSEQSARFLETARVLGCDEDEAVFNEKLKVVVKPKGEILKASSTSETAKDILITK